MEENGRVKATRAPYSNKSDGLTLLGPGGYFRGGAFKPPFLNALLSTINTKLRAHSDSVFKLLENTQGYDYVEGTSYAAAFIASLVALMKRVNPNLSAKKIEEILCDSSIDDEIVEGYDNLHGCGLVDPISALEMAEEARSQSVVAISKPRIINLGNFYDQDNQKPFKIVVKNIGGGKFGQLTKENIIFRTPFKKVSVDIDNEKSWLKLTEIKTIKPQQEFELTFKFDRSSINKYIINKNPDKVFTGDLIIVPEGVKEELIIPIYVFGGKEVYEKITEPISILVYEKDEFETKINPQPIYTTTPNENLEFELPELDNNKEYRVIATTDKNWWSGTAGKEFYWGQIIIKKGSLEPKTLTIYISKYKK